MSRTITPEHRAAMDEGRELQLEEDRARKLSDRLRYSAWVQEDARLWRAYQATGGRQTSEGEVAYSHWSANLRDLPVTA